LLDATGDAVLDVVMLTPEGVTMLPGDRRGGFGRAATLVPGAQRYAAGDANGDGRQDLFVVIDGTVQARLQSATGTFAPAWSVSTPAGWFPPSIATGDIDGDGGSDVVLNGDDLTVLSGSDGRSVTVPGVVVPIDVVGSGDLEGDGDADVLSFSGHSGFALGFSVTSAGRPTALQYVRTDPWLSHVREAGLVVGDIGSDGTPEVVVASTSGLLVLRPAP
jgi:hypothetical protein